MRNTNGSRIALRILYTAFVLALGICIGAEGALHLPQLVSAWQERTSFGAESSVEIAAEPDPAESSVTPDQSALTPTESEQEEPVEEEEPDPQAVLEQQAETILESMSLTERIYQMFIVTQEQLTGYSTVTQSGSATEQAIQNYPVGGIIYFESNIVSPDQCTAMISGIQSYSKLGLFIAVDEEGGRVARLGNNSAMGTTSFPSMSEIGSSGSTERAYEVGYTIGSEISQFGFNLDFAPVADVNSNPDNPVIGDRSFSSDAETASEMVAAAVQGFRDSGTLCTLKHFPGHGDTSTDSHAGYTEVTKTLEELYQVELKPFQAGIDAGADFVMVGHLSVPQVTGDDLPATLSKTMIDLLKDDLGFEGLIITDSMSMGAITDHYSSGEAAVLAVQAGIDIILMPADLQSAVNGIASAVESGSISEERINESVRKILQVKLEQGILAPAEEQETE